MHSNRKLSPRNQKQNGEGWPRAAFQTATNKTSEHWASERHFYQVVDIIAAIGSVVRDAKA